MSNAGPTSLSLTLSDDRTIESILSDIPFFCVGLMTFGVFTFVLVLKRVDLIAIYLYASSFLAFAAAIVDLGRVLAQGRALLADGTGDAAAGLVTVREVFLALSLGFMYTFLWYLVAKCPRSVRHQPLEGMDSDAEPGLYIHSASWRRWGVIGFFLQWTLLGLSFSVPILQVIWRVAPSNLRFGPIYIAESTIEVVVSTLFMLKIFLNTLLSPVTPWWRPIQADVAPLMALSISAGLGLGNLVNLAFSETTLGRFLRALEMYILILFVMITAFYKVPSEPSRASNDPEKSFIRISEMPQPPLLRANPQRLPPLIISSSIIPRRLSVPANNHERSRRSRHSSWVIPRNSDQRTSGANRVYVEDGGIGTGPAEVRFVHTGSPSPIEEMQKAQVAAEINAEADDTDVHEQLTVSKIPSFTGISISSYYGMERFSNTQYMPPPPGVVARDTDSPVYGLNGIMARIQGQGKLSRPHRSISFSDLLRQQTELDKSIAALRLFSSDDATSALIIPSPPPTASLSLSSYVRYGPKQSKDDSTGSYFGRKPDSASNRSDFSLSIFPEPPAVENELPASTKLERLVGRAQTLRRERTESSQMIPINVTGDDGPLLPASPTQFEGSLRLESAGTQYDATSFIGGLTIPSRGDTSLTIGSTLVPDSSGLATSGPRPSDVDSEDDSTYQGFPITATMTQAAIRPMILASTALVSSHVTVDVTPSESSSPDRFGDLSKLRRDPSLPLRPFLLGTSSQAVPMILPSHTMVPIGPRRKGLPNNARRPTISGPSLPPDDGRGDQAPGAFERPRPPPLLIPK